MRSCSRSTLLLTSARSGLTLIELLIVVTIFLVLTTFTVVAVDFTFEAERVSSGARQVQSLLEGARDRAIRAREPRGVRFLLDPDPDNGRMVSSMVYVGASDTWTEGTIELRREDVSPADGVADQEDVLIVAGSLDTLWSKLSQRGFLGIQGQETPRIKIPGDKNGTWYRVQTNLLGADPLNPNVLRLVHPYRDPGTTEITEIQAFDAGSGPSTYILELPPRVLPDADPVLLPEGVVIDLDASSVPTDWRPAAGSGYSAPYSSRMDLMFSPRGTLIGTTAGTGLTHFYIALREDVEKAISDPLPKRPPVNIGDRPLVPADALFASLASGGTVPTVGDRGLVSIFASTGKVSSHAFNMDTNEDRNNNGTLDPGEDINGNSVLDVNGTYLVDPFQFAELGEVNN
ncbi:MAG: prepilin-type N-terminal cleavage/methylation domain-containing protein [Planctomycetota bacterium]|nr:prepilin-type N-terminal cleavage/methylation domain-containing protein [Planctomycetota bacterium]MDA0920461.1 prepilin-type N-terminal cleavage/methylation domain-containing protein [Planctomycetota bacterium]